MVQVVQSAELVPAQHKSSTNDNRHGVVHRCDRHRDQFAYNCPGTSGVAFSSTHIPWPEFGGIGTPSPHVDQFECSYGNSQSIEVQALSK